MRKMHISLVPRDNVPLSHDLWISVAASQGRPKNSLVEFYQLHSQSELTNSPHASPVPQRARVLPLLGVRFGWTNGLSFDVIIKIMDDTLQDDIIATTVEVPRGGESLKECVESSTANFDRGDLNPNVNIRQWPRETRPSDRVVREIPSLGVVTVRIKKLGRAWDPAFCRPSCFQYSKLLLVWLIDGRLVENGGEYAEGWPAGDVRYLVDIKLE